MSSEHHNSNVQQWSGCKLISVFQFGATKTEMGALICALCHHYSHINPALPVQTLKRPAGTLTAHITSFHLIQTRFSSWLTVSSSAASSSPLRGSVMFWMQMSELIRRSPERIVVFIRRLSLCVFLSPRDVALRCVALRCVASRCVALRRVALRPSNSHQTHLDQQ